MSNRIEMAFADGVYEFALPLPRIDELQRKTGVGIGGLFARVLKGCIEIKGSVIQLPQNAEFYALDIIETIRQGLIGGGRGMVDGNEIEVTPALAHRLIENYVLTEPLNKSWSLAGAILGACVMGYTPPKKDQPAAKRAPRASRSKKAASTTA
jgi:hypothetical protein